MGQVTNGRVNGLSHEKELDLKIDQLVLEMTLEEKAALLSGRDDWSTKPVERLGIPWVWMSDGPHGLRRAPSTDKPGFGDQLPSTCFPTASALSASWDRELLYKVGEILGDECQALNVNILLGPGVNIKRHPLGGRNFEYLSEDPLLAGELGVAVVNGIQSKGVGACVKHFAANNQETRRMVSNSKLDQRTLHEIYLPAFKRVVEKSAPWTVMSSYNRINGTYGTQHKELLEDTLRNQYGFDGVVMSDWMAVIDRPASLAAGTDLEMPSSKGYHDRQLVQKVREKMLDESVLDTSVKRMLRLIFTAKARERKDVKLNVEEHHLFARKTAADTIVLLKNDQGLLPIANTIQKIAVIGEFAANPRIQGNGSSEVKPTTLDKALDEIIKQAGPSVQVVYARGYDLAKDDDTSYIKEAVKTAAEAELVLVFAGLPSSYESEGYDRKHIDLPLVHNRLIEEIAAVQKNTAVILTNGSAVSMPWHGRVKAIVESWLIGQAGGGAIADILFGKVSPSGKLAETFPVQIEDTPAYTNFPGEEREVIYGERFYVGYRHYDRRKIAPLFPFGHGLSYTTFEYSDLSFTSQELNEYKGLEVSFRVKNTGKTRGKEVVQLYTSPEGTLPERSVQELRGFHKVELAPGEEKTVRLALEISSFTVYDEVRRSFIPVEGGYKVLVGSSSRDIRLSGMINVKLDKPVKPFYDYYTFLADLFQNPRTNMMARSFFSSWIMPFAKAGQKLEEVEIPMFLADNPLIKFTYLTGGSIDRKSLDEFIRILNEF